MKKTSISFGLVNIPVEINPIIKNNDISFNQIHEKCGTRIQYIKYCPHCKKEVKQIDIVKGYEYEDNEYITLTKEEFDNLKSEDEKTIEVVGFVNLKDIDPVYFEKSYVVLTTTKNKAYNLFKAALDKTKKVALAKTVIGSKFYYVILRTLEKEIIMNTLYFSEEVNIPEMEIEAEYSKKELDLAIELIGSLDMKFNPHDLKDIYYEKVKEAIELKIEGKQIKKPRKKKETKIKDLMTALEMSLKNV